MKTLLACACACAVVLLVDPERVVFSLVVAWIGLAVALAPVIGGALRNRRRRATPPQASPQTAPGAETPKPRRQSLWVPGMGSISKRSFPYGQSSR
jgi:hypothetical protein